MMFWRRRRVFLTGHTGFKGGWLSLWLQHLGADVRGYALEAPTQPSLFADAKVAQEMSSVIGDIRDLGALRRSLVEHQPEVVIHMAAQPLVRHSYADPLGTYAVNVLGTANVLEAVRQCPSVRSVVVITTDKCYENREWVWGYREDDPLGGYDPYSSSKACAEIVVSAYRRSYFNPALYDEHRVAIATARAGNVIGGGDWATDRLIPDTVRAFLAGHDVRIRNPRATRPWQHVLEPLRGYLVLAERLYEDGADYGHAFNFGPEYSDIRPVGWIVSQLAESWGSGAHWTIDDEGGHPHEAQTLRLDWSRAAAELSWRPMLRLSDGLAMTVEWYRAWEQRRELRDTCLRQIDEYVDETTADTERRGVGAGN